MTDTEESRIVVEIDGAADAESVDGAPWHIDFIALPLGAEREGWSGEVPICQSGTCNGCNENIRSWSKQAVCPVCGNSVYCT